jgi:predicted AAA+ superfamily ATPase
MIHRKQLEKIKQTILGDPVITVIYGPRQVGKTTLAKQIISEIGGEVLKFNGDDIRTQQDWSKHSLDHLKRVVGESKYIFIDEAQKIPNIGLSLKLLYDELQCRIIVTGSAQLELAQKISEPLTGRLRAYVLYPTSIYEVTLTPPQTAKRELPVWLRFGMYPKTLTLIGQNDKQEYLENLVNTYLYKDLLELGQIRRPTKVVDLLRLLALQIGSLVSVNELAKNLSLNRATVENYLDILEKMFIIKPLYGFSRNLRKEIAKNHKYYFYDLGVRNALLGNFSELDRRADVGQLFENFSVMEKIKSTEILGTRGNFYFWRTYEQQEVDLVFESGGEITGYEFKYGKKQARPPKSFQDTYQAKVYSVNSDNFFDNLR